MKPEYPANKESQKTEVKEENPGAGFVSTAEKPGEVGPMDPKKPYYPHLHLGGKAAGVCAGADIGDEKELVVKVRVTGKQERGTDLEVIGVKKYGKESKRII